MFLKLYKNIIYYFLSVDILSKRNNPLSISYLKSLTAFSYC